MFGKPGQILIVVGCCIQLSGCLFVFAPHVSYETPKIFGRITENQIPVADVKVNLYNPLPKELIASATTDKDGRFIIEPTKKYEYFIPLVGEKLHGPPLISLHKDRRDIFDIAILHGPGMLTMSCEIKNAPETHLNNLCNFVKAEE